MTARRSDSCAGPPAALPTPAVVTARRAQTFCGAHAGGMRRRSRPSRRSFSQRTGPLRATHVRERREPAAPTRQIDGRGRARARAAACRAGASSRRRNSLFNRATSTPTGHSVLHARHSRHRSSTSRTPSSPRPASPSSAGHRQPQRVRAPARRVRLLARRHERRAHRPVQRLAARAEAAAHLDRPGEAAVAPSSRRTSTGCGVRYAGPYRRLAVSGGASTILPGLKMPSGSNVRLICRNAS